MSQPEIRIPEEIAPQVFALASRYYADFRQDFTESELVKAGSEVDIPPEFIQKAIQDIQAQASQKLEQQKRIQHQRQLLIKIGAGILSVILLWSIWIYNSFAKASVQVEAAWAQVENQLQRRADLLPNLVNVTQAYADHEQSLANTLIQAHQSYLEAATIDEKAAAMGEVDRAIEQFYDYATAHSELQSNQLFTNLQYEIAGTENRLTVERMRYNQAVQHYNQTIQSFPNSLLATALHLQNKPFFKTADSTSPQTPEK